MSSAMKVKSTLWGIDGPDFSAAVVEVDGIIVRAAPVYDWKSRIGREIKDFKTHCAQKGWKIYKISEKPAP